MSDTRPTDSADASVSNTVISAVTWLGIVPFLVAAAIHTLASDGVMVFVWLHATTAWLYLGVLPFLGVALVRRKPKQIGAGVLVLAAWVVFNRPPATLGGAPIEAGASVRLVSSNALMVNPTPQALVDEILSFEPDVIAFQEFTPDIQAAMGAAAQGRWRKREHPAWHSFGVGLYSRFPIVSERLVEIGGVDWQRAVIDVKGQLVEIWNVHTLPPFHPENHEPWLGQVATLAAQSTKVKTPLLVAGDFNLTRHHAGYAALTGSMVDAHRDCGRWVASTWPANGFFFAWAPRIKLDHVFLGGGARCSAVYEGVGAGSDHRPIIADIVLPR